MLPVELCSSQICNGRIATADLVSLAMTRSEGFRVNQWIKIEIPPAELTVLGGFESFSLKTVSLPKVYFIATGLSIPAEADGRLPLRGKALARVLSFNLCFSEEERIFRRFFRNPLSFTRVRCIIMLYKYIKCGGGASE